MQSGDVGRVRGQVQYILDCGGIARQMTHIINTMSMPN
jgi:hypothetical protein